MKRERLHVEELLTTGEVAALAGCHPKTVTRWAEEGRLPFRRTLGGHRRFPARVVRELLSAGSEPLELGR